MSKRLIAHISILFANVIYGVNYTIAKEIMPDYIKPAGLVFCRVLGAIILFWGFSLFTKSSKIERKDFFRLIIAAIFGVALNQLLFLYGLNYTTPIDASIIMTVNPILVLIIASILIKEVITLRKISGIIIGGIGAIILIFYSGEVSLSSNHFIGNLMIFTNALSYGIYLVVVKPLMLKYEAVTVMKWVFLFGFFIIAPVGFEDFSEINWKQFPLNISLSVLYVIIGTTFLAYLLNVYGLKFLNASTVSIYIYSQPIIASLVAIIFGKDSLTAIKIISTILVFVGVYLVSKPKEKRF
ncbi:MAG: DMT family transporter [Bacteroidales bacterium]|nr:DMT family transporter [Bacteroidales bacterium]